MRNLLAAIICWFVLSEIFLISFPLVTYTADEACASEETDKAVAFADSIATDLGWSENLKRGKTIMQELSSPDKKKKFNVDAFRGEKVAFVAGTAPPGATNDLVTNDGFYLRIVNDNGKDWRPNSVSWGVIVYGEISQVFPENKIIVIKVHRKKDWYVFMTT